MEYKLTTNLVRQMLSSTDTNVTASQMFEKYQQQKKNRNPKSVALCVIRKIFAKKVDINVEILKKSHDFAHHPVLWYTILQLILVKNKTRILAT